MKVQTALRAKIAALTEDLPRCEFALSRYGDPKASIPTPEQLPEEVKETVRSARARKRKRWRDNVKRRRTSNAPTGGQP